MSYGYNLGNYSRSVTTHSRKAQEWFDRGLAWTYGFNHEEAINCFREAAEADPECLMAHWGIAYAAGPNYNKPWEAFDEEELATMLRLAYDSSRHALLQSTNCEPWEKHLIEALYFRYGSREPRPIEEMCSWNDKYVEAMSLTYARHERDPDITSLFAEALLNRTPWALWDLETGKPAPDADTEEAISVLEEGIALREKAREKPHAGMLHMYIHAMEMSPTPERALRAGDMLRNLIPDSGHLCHMATHIDVICGDYLETVNSNDAAIKADQKFLEREGPLNFYTLYRCHNYHFKVYGAMFLGQFRVAIETADEMIATIPEKLLKVESPPMADWLEGFIPVRQHVLVRFGRWDDILSQALPADTDLYCVTTATMRYARALAHATLNRVAEAEREAEAFEEAFSRIPDSRYLFNNSCKDILAVARKMMHGEIEYRRGQFDLAFEHLREAVKLDDSLPYDEPWGWMQPVRHALGALLLEQGRIEEAAETYRTDLGLASGLNRPCQHPDNVWSLHGYHECLRRLGRTDEAKWIKKRLDIALARVDVPLNASCYCKLSAV